MIEIQGNHPSYTLILPVEYDLGRNSNTIRGNWMSNSGILSTSSISNLGLPMRFTPKDAKTGEYMQSLLAFQESLSNSDLNVVLSEIFKQNETVRSELKKVVTEFVLFEMEAVRRKSRRILMEDDGIKEEIDEYFEKFVHTKGAPCEHIFRMPKTELLNDQQNITQEESTTLWQIEEDSYESLYATTRQKVGDMIKTPETDSETMKAGQQS